MTAERGSPCPQSCHVRWVPGIPKDHWVGGSPQRKTGPQGQGVGGKGLESPMREHQEPMAPVVVIPSTSKLPPAPDPWPSQAVSGSGITHLSSPTQSLWCSLLNLGISVPDLNPASPPSFCVEFSPCSLSPDPPLSLFLNCLSKLFCLFHKPSPLHTHHWPPPKVCINSKRDQIEPWVMFRRFCLN